MVDKRREERSSPNLRRRLNGRTASFPSPIHYPSPSPPPPFPVPSHAPFLFSFTFLFVFVKHQWGREEIGFGMVARTNGLPLISFFLNWQEMEWTNFWLGRVTVRCVFIARWNHGDTRLKEHRNREFSNKASGEGGSISWMRRDD